MLSIDIWLKPYTVITTQLGSDVGVLGVGVYMQAMIYIYMVPYGRRMDHGLKYLFVENTGSGSFPLP